MKKLPLPELTLGELSPGYADIIKRGKTLALARPVDVAVRSEVYTQMALPFMAEGERASPNVFLRSALFGVVANGRRTWYDNAKLASVAGYDIFYTGACLSCDDFDLWQSIIYFAQNTPLGEKAEFTAYELLKAKNLKDTGPNREILNQQLTRLVASAVRIQTKEYTFEGSLIGNMYRDEKTNKYCITTNPDLVSLFGKSTYTLLDWEVRKGLGRNQLAKFLHGFYSTHARPFPYKITTLLELANVKNPLSSSSKQKITNALNLYCETSTAAGIPVSYQVVDGTIHLKRQPTSTQQRSLLRSRTNSSKRT